MVSLPPSDGSILISQAADFHRAYNPTSPIYVYADGEPGEPKTITHLEFARACHRVAYAVRRPEHTSEETPVIAIIALCDTIVYQALILGIHKAGLVPFPISPRNSPAAIFRLLKATSCHRILSTKTTLKQLIEGVEQELANDGDEFQLSIEEAPSLKYIFPKLGVECEEDPFTPYPEYSIRPNLSSVALYLHSSGSTGFPKAIPLTQKCILCWAVMPVVTDTIACNIPLQWGVMAVPSFHILGIYLQLLLPMFSGRAVAVYPPTVDTDEALPVMPAPDNVLDHTRRTKCNGLVAIPAFFQAWSHSPETLEFLRTLAFICHGGGAFPPKVGMTLAAAGVISRSMYGSTEVGTVTHFLHPDGEHVENEWQWLRFCDKVKLDWVPQGDGTYELHYLRGETDHICIYNLPNDGGYATSDLFRKHPTKEGLWRIVGRKDDVIVHASGEKTVPVPLEDIINADPLVHGAIIFGERQSQPGVLIELKDSKLYPQDDRALESLRNTLWPVIEEANRIAPAFSRIYKDMILIVSPRKPLPRTAKGTAMRKAALKLYEEEIQYLYDTIEMGVASTTTTNPATWTADCLRAWLITQVQDLIPKAPISIALDLFEQGFDSLTATLLRHRIVAALRSTLGHKFAVNISQTLVYDHPTIEKLAIGLEKLATGSALSVEDRKSRMESLIDFNITNLEPMRASIPHNARDNSVVLLTGSTGGLGSHILAVLLQHDSVARVYTLDRHAEISIDARQQASFRNRGLDISLLTSHKLVPLSADLTKADFALPQTIFHELRTSVTIIIHNAWTLDFNLALSAFEPLIAGTRNLINLARRSSYASSIRFLFTSSITAVQSWKEDRPVPEETIHDPSLAIGTGYGESKYVAEMILAASGVQACSLRIGQICGGEPNGAWSTTDWVPILVKSSLELKVLPEAKGTVSWVPMDCVAQAALDVAFSTRPLPAVINIVHPRPVTWASVFTLLRNALYESSRGGIDLPLVSFREWFFSLEKHAEGANGGNLHRLPAMKLLAFFQHLVHADEEMGYKPDQESGGFPYLETGNAQGISPSIRRINEIGKLDVSRWVQYWTSEGLFG